MAEALRIFLPRDANEKAVDLVVLISTGRSDWAARSPFLGFHEVINFYKGTC